MAVLAMLPLALVSGCVDEEFGVWPTGGIAPELPDGVSARSGGVIVIEKGLPAGPGNPLADEGGYTCQNVWDCFDQCERHCFCKPTQDDNFCCCNGEWGCDHCEWVVEPEDGGIGGGGGGGACGDLRDTLAAEYALGEFGCRDFYWPGPKWVVPFSKGIEWGLKHAQYGYMDDRVTGKIGRMEAHFDIIAFTTSGYRCPVGNSNVGGVDGSWHTKGRGYDFVVLGDRWTQQLKNDIVTWAYANGAVEAYSYANKPHVHLAW